MSGQTIDQILAGHTVLVRESAHALGGRDVDVVHEGFDLALRGGGPLPDSSLVGRKLLELPRVVCAAPSYLEAHGVPKSPEDLRDHRCLIYSASSSSQIWTFRKANLERTVEVNGPLRVNNSLALVRAALGGAGIALVPVFAAREELARKTLKAVLTTWQSERHALYAIYPQHRQNSPKLRALLDFLAQRWAAEGEVPVGVPVR